MLDVLKRYAQSLREGLGDKHNFFLMITGKIKVVEDKSQDQRKDLYENEKSKADLGEEAMSLMESSKTHFKSLRSPKNAKEMDIDTSWERSYEIEVTKLREIST